MQTKFLRRWLISMALCCTYSLLQAQLVTKVEYFFDTDPGIGNGTAINISTPALTVDATFTFDVSALSNGLHMLYVRTQDNLNRWSLNYSNSFIKTNGADGPLTIVKMEYFVDTDPGYGSAINMPVTTAGIVDSTFEFIVPDNGADTRYLAVRALDSKGQWSLLYDINVNMCDLYKSKPNFSWIRYADQFSFIDSSLNNPSHRLLWKFDNLGTDSVSNPQFVFPQGNHYTKLISGVGCRKDSITMALFTGVESYYPDTALAGGNVAMAFFGGGMDTAVTVTLSNGSGNLAPVEKIATEQKLLLSLFDLHTTPPGVYDVHLHFPGGYDTTITSGLRVIGAAGGITYEPDINITMVGPDVSRPGSTVRVDMIVSNNGGMLAEQIPVTFTFSQDGVGLASGYNYNLNYMPPPSPVYPYEDSIPHFVGIDSLFGKPYNGRLQNFLVPYLNAGESFTVPLYVTLPLTEGSSIEITAWPGKRMLGSPLRNQWGSCIDAAADFVFGLVPVLGCANGLYNYFHFGSNGVGEWAWNTFGTAVSCLPGVGTAQALIKNPVVLNILEHPKAFTDIAHNTASGLYASLGSCEDANDPNKKEKKITKKKISADPNDISGPNGYAGENYNYIRGTGKYGYRVGFENLPTATANAQRVYIADTLDKDKFDLRTFELINYAVGDSFYTIPLQRKEFTRTTDLAPGANLQLRFNAKLDTATGILRYSFLSIDPLTRDTLPLSDIRGFLPPDIDGHSGRGAVSYVVKMKNNLTTLTQVNNKAAIIFDNNAPIITNAWLNTIDKAAPTGGVTGGVRINDTTVRLTLGGTDVGVGIERYDLFISENMKPFYRVRPIMGDTVRFTGSLDSTYRFYAIPYDSVNNVADKLPVAEYSITFSSVLPVTLLNFDAQKQGKDVAATWQTNGEINFNRFEVERSTDGVNFIKAGTVLPQAGTATKNYLFTDVNAVVNFSSSKNLYYRLKMIDNDDRSKLSRTARIELNRKYSVTVYPNPAKDQLFVDGMSNYHAFTITDMAGKKVVTQNIAANVNTINISTLPGGVYILVLHADDDERSVKFIKKQ